MRRDKLGRFVKGIEPHNKGKGWKNEVRICLKCNNQFNPMKKDSEFCSKGCASSYRQIGVKKSIASRINMSLTRTGDKIFTGFKRNINYRLRRSNDWKQWRELIFDIINGISYCKDYHLKGNLHLGGDLNVC
ncbi:hypothetical protein LCGC14_1165010 [marine sediment metagenome]|uniref:Uncharacterized protein n=1 Tax=marine sediment metagenome TaxID=412755 RepID=A0A0F9PX16_9ZZZZ